MEAQLGAEVHYLQASLSLSSPVSLLFSILASFSSLLFQKDRRHFLPAAHTHDDKIREAFPTAFHKPKKAFLLVLVGPCRTPLPEKLMCLEGCAT